MTRVFHEETALRHRPRIGVLSGVVSAGGTCLAMPVMLIGGWNIVKTLALVRLAGK